MHADSSAGVEVPPAGVSGYFVDNEDALNAGVADVDDMPTTGHWFWRDVDASRIRTWVFRHRHSLWGMLYGDCPVP